MPSQPLFNNEPAEWPVDQDLATYQQKAFAKHMLFDMPFPVLGTVPILVLIAWLLLDKVSALALGLWALFAALVLVSRSRIDSHMRKQVIKGEGHAAALRYSALLALPTGAISGAFAWMYFDPLQPITMVILGTYMTVVIVGAILPTSVYLPSFYLLVMPAHLPYVAQLMLSGGSEHMVVAGINLMFLGVVFAYAHAANKQHLETVGLRYENERLVDDLEVRKAQAEKALQTKSLFLAGVSHDLKQPIRAIAMYAGFLRHSAPRDGTRNVVTQTAEKIETAVGAIHDQVSRLLELSRLESGAMPLHLEWLDLGDLFKHLHERHAGDAQAHGVQLRFALSPQRQAWADRAMLESILSNFISNAIKHTEGGRVYVGTRLRTEYPKGQRLCIEVRDSGSGIPPERVALLFDAYRTFDDRTASESHGLGLAIAKAQATYLGCDIDVRTQLGRGSAFTLCGLREL